MVLFWDCSCLERFLFKADMGGRPADPNLHLSISFVDTWRLAGSAGSKVGSRAVSSSAHNVLSRVSEPPGALGATCMCSRSPARWSLAPVRAGGGTCSPRWKRCQTASCGKDPSSAAQLAFTSLGFLAGLFLFFGPFIFFHFGPIPLHQFLNILWGTLLARKGRNLNQRWPQCAACFELGRRAPRH